jgi:hypothetical protein
MLAVLPTPLADGLPRHAQPPRRLGLIVPLVEQRSRRSMAATSRESLDSAKDNGNRLARN